MTSAILTLSLFALLAGPSQTAAPEGTRYAEALDRSYGAAIDQARQVIDARLDEYPGLSVAVGMNGHIVWSQGFGWADIEGRVSARPASRFRVGSVAKPMTTALLVLLYEEGKIDLDAHIQLYVPGFPEKRHPITTRQLAGHLAGIRHYNGDEFLISRRYASILAGLEIFDDDPLLFEPETDYSYSTYGWNLISAVIEGAVDGDFLELMDERVFYPLEMRSTEADQNRLIVMDRVRPYIRNNKGQFENAPYVDNSYKWAGGGFVSTAEDLVRFGMAHLNPGFLKPETVKLLWTSQITRDGKETGYGIGWRVGRDKKGRRVIGHGGGSVGGTTRLSIYPEQGLVIAIISNMSNAPQFDTEEIADQFLAR